MKYLSLSSKILMGLTVLALAACTQASHETAEKVDSAVKTAKVETVQKNAGFEYVAMEGFSYDMGKWVGLVEGESFAESEAKINAAFKAYDGHAEPKDISMDAQIVEADWKQVLVTQDGLMDGTVTGQQLLAVFDEEKKLVSYGMRIKCHTAQGDADWQNTVC